MRVKKNISIEEDLKDKAVKRAKSMSLTFSAYVISLILKDLGEMAITEEKPKNNKVTEAVDNILGM